jgi:hypothetical protein
VSPCVGEPISWLRLERYELGELPQGERAQVAEHLQRCPACRACFAEIEAVRELPELRLPARRIPQPSAAEPRLRWPLWLTGFAGALAALALLFMPRGGEGPGLEPPASSKRVKGGELALELVRLDAQGRQREPDRFEPSDRFKILLTCPPQLRAHAQAVIYQAGQAYFPLEPQGLSRCGNRIALSGAFQLDGTEPVLVCTAISEAAAPARTQLEKGPDSLPELSVCTRVHAADSPR